MTINKTPVEECLMALNALRLEVHESIVDDIKGKVGLALMEAEKRGEERGRTEAEERLLEAEGEK
jgi:hypothetical protein